LRGRKTGNIRIRDLDGGSRKKAKPMKPGNKLVEKSVFQTLCALPHALCFFIPNSHRGVGAGPYGPEAAFPLGRRPLWPLRAGGPLPNSNICPPSSDIRHLSSDICLPSSVL
jgi:hypothetical protein